MSLAHPFACSLTLLTHLPAPQCLLGLHSLVLPFVRLLSHSLPSSWESDYMSQNDMVFSHSGTAPPRNGGPQQQKIKTSILGHWLICSLICSHRSLAHSRACGKMNDYMQGPQAVLDHYARMRFCGKLDIGPLRL